MIAAECLKELQLLCCEKIDEECIKLLSNAGSKITCLRIEYPWWQADDKALEYIGQSQLPLEKLEMEDWHNMTDNGLLHLMKKNLTHLTLVSCPLHDSSLEILAQFRALRHLIQGCCGFSDKGLENIKKVRRNLKVTISGYYE